jgi:hypothetical protein
MSNSPEIRIGLTASLKNRISLVGDGRARVRSLFRAQPSATVDRKSTVTVKSDEFRSAKSKQKGKNLLADALTQEKQLEQEGLIHL